MPLVFFNFKTIWEFEKSDLDIIKKNELSLFLGEEELLIKDQKMREVLVNPLTGRVWQEGDVYTRFKI